MNGHILALSTAVPSHTLTQAQALENVLAIFPKCNREQMKSLYQNSGIEKRHVVTNDYLVEPSKRAFLGEDYPKTIPGMSKRNDFYKKMAPNLAEEAAQKALKQWGGDPLSITHVIAITCTGVVIPGIEFGLIESLKLKRSIHRLGINFMGCFGAFKGLEVAHAFVKSNPKSRVLIVSIELCSLHIQANDTQDSIMANSLFADGAAAAIIGRDLLSGEVSLFEMLHHASFGLNDSWDLMGWEASDHGYVMKLSPFVPVLLARHIKNFTQELIQSYAKTEACDFAIHPGGKAIVHTIEKKLGLNKMQTQASWNTLANYGNMSSATFLFVLNDLIKQPDRKEWTVGLGFGPGLSVEGLLLKRE